MRAEGLRLQVSLCCCLLAAELSRNGAVCYLDAGNQFVGATGDDIADGEVVRPLTVISGDAAVGVDDHIDGVHFVLHNLIKFVWHIRHDPYVEAFSSFHKR